MIYVVRTPKGDAHPAVVIHPTLAFPLYRKAWGVSSPLLEWHRSGLSDPTHVVLSQPWRSFRRRKRIGDLDFADRIRMMRAAAAIPSLLCELRDVV